MQSEVSMEKRRIMFLFLTFFLTVYLVGDVNARGEIFVIEPMQEVTESIELEVSDKTAADVTGSLSVANGFIDFYVTSPSRIVLLCYNETSFNRFNFTAIENGTYVMHLASRYSKNNVTASLDYGVNWEITVQATIRPRFHTIAVWQVTVQPTSPFDWIGILRWVCTLITTISALVALPQLVLKSIKWLYWKIKHGKSKTPVVALTDKIVFLCESFFQPTNLET